MAERIECTSKSLRVGELFGNTDRHIPDGAALCQPRYRPRVLKPSPAVRQDEDGKDTEPERMYPCQSDQPSYACKANDCGDHQAAGASQHEPQQRSKDLTAIERIDGQHVENQKLRLMNHTARNRACALGVAAAQPRLRLRKPSAVRMAKSATFTSGPAAMLHSVAPGRGGGSTYATPPRGHNTMRFALPRPAGRPARGRTRATSR
jgi:hypothetical protein